MALGLGVDKPDVRLVVHWGPPASPELYAQQAGRAGRDGLPAACVLLHAPSDWSRLRGLSAAEGEPRHAEAAAAMRSLAHCSGCRCGGRVLSRRLRPQPRTGFGSCHRRRAALLRYLGDTLPPRAAAPEAPSSPSARPEPAPCCDNCSRGQGCLERCHDVASEARALLLAAEACGGRFGLPTVLEVCRGARTAKLASKAAACSRHGPERRFGRSTRMAQ